MVVSNMVDSDGNDNACMRFFIAGEIGMVSGV